MRLTDAFHTFIAHYPDTLSGDLLRYLIGAGGVYLVVNTALSALIAQRKIRADAPPRRQMVREFVLSMRTVLIFAAFGTLIHLGANTGIMPIYFAIEDYGVPWLIASTLLIIIAHDAWFYWSHWIMHRPRLYRWFHRAHHKSHNPTPFTAYSFDMTEAAVNAVFFPLILLTVPAHPIALFIFTWHMMLRNAVGHCGYEIFPARADGRPRFDWMTTVTHHDIHHAEARWNFGLYFTWWDRIMDTEHPDYRARFAAAGKAARASGATTALVALAFIAAPSDAAASDPAQGDITGLWATEGLEGVVRIAPCEVDPDRRCGAVVWVWSEDDWPEGPVGAIILTDLARDGDDWSGGRLIHPETGYSYRGSARRVGPDTLVLEGCAAFLCDSVRWRSLGAIDALQALQAASVDR